MTTPTTASAAAPAPTTLYTVRQGAAWITLNRPDQRNALSAALVNALHADLQTALADPGVRAIVLTGAGSAFCAGADLKSPPGQVVDGQQSVSLATVLALMQDAAKPVIAAINGAAFAGGLGLVGASDLVITSDDAPYSFSEVKIGVIPAVISVVCLPKLGPLHGMKLFLTGERFTGAQAVAYGLAHQAVPAASLAGQRRCAGGHAQRRRADRGGRMQEAGAPHPHAGPRHRLRRGQQLERAHVPQP